MNQGNKMVIYNLWLYMTTWNNPENFPDRHHFSFDVYPRWRDDNQMGGEMGGMM